MAQYLLYRIAIFTDPSAPAIPDPLPNGTIITIYYDDSVPGITVDFGGEPGGLYNLGVEGTNFTVIEGGTSVNPNGDIVSGYSFCDGTTLNWFSLQSTYPSYPYAVQKTVADSPVCDVGGGVVCDITFSGAPSITHATNLTSNNGQIVVSATSGNGTVKYGLSNFDYATGGQTSGAFAGLSPGSYTIYAKDENDCTAQFSFTILFEPAYGEHYVFGWRDVDENRDARVRIYEREYSGDVVEIKNGEESPFFLNKSKPQAQLNNKFYPIHTTTATLRLTSTVSYQFLPLFTQDDRRFIFVYEVNEGSGFTPLWNGYIVPSVYQEGFIDVPYESVFELTDNVKSLNKRPFTDNDENSLKGRVKLIKVISQIMQKTGLSLSIRSGINIFEESHNTAASDDPLDQTYIELSCYQDEDGEPFSCWQVLESILQPFGARIYQCDNLWIIEEIDRATSSYAFRLFNANGDYVSNSTFDPIKDIKSSSESNRVVPLNEDQNQEVIPAYGNIDVISKLNYIGSVRGGFEKTDLLSPEAEETQNSQGVYISEEGFKGWTLRLNGTSGVSFGRVIIGEQHGEIRQGLERSLKDRSVGAFSFNPKAWGGNLRDAYIESAAVPYEYGPGSDIKFSFQYSAPVRPNFEFMVLRCAVKLGSNYLQQDYTWAGTEVAFRSYPVMANTLQKFEITAAAPDTTENVSTTIQVRIYFYSAHFFDYGLPALTGGPVAGSEGFNGLRALVTTTIKDDYRVDIRDEYDHNGDIRARRLFYELRVDTIAGEDVPQIVQPTDHNNTTNKKNWFLLKAVQDNDELTNRSRGLDVKFYIDNVFVDTLLNGQAPPKEETISFEVSKFIDENMEVTLYNFDCPDIVNSKNMYNNYFRLSDGSPTALWTRSGVDELLPIQQILLKVLGANHSAPTFRITGSFLSESLRIGINNYLRLTKPGSTLAVSNTTFASNLTGWSQTGSGEAFAWSADNSGSAQVTLSGSEDSQKLYQQITHNGGHIQITVNVEVIATSTNDREDVLWVVFYNGSSLVHMEKMRTFARPTSTSSHDFTYTAFVPGSVTRIGFFLKRVAGTGDCTYNIGTFAPVGAAIQEIYQIADYSFNEKHNTYNLELMQQSKSYISLQGVDQGGTNQGDGTVGSSFSGDFNNDFGGDFDTTLN